MAHRKASYSSELTRPGLQKVRKPPILLRRSVKQVSVSAGRMLYLIDSASVMSEGQMRSDDSGTAYFGTTTLLFPLRTPGISLTEEDMADLKTAIEFDPLSRLAVLRIAYREATLRAGAPLDSIQAEIRSELVPRGLLVHVDVSAAALNQRAVNHTRG